MKKPAIQERMGILDKRVEPYVKDLFKGSTAGDKLCERILYQYNLLALKHEGVCINKLEASFAVYEKKRGIEPLKYCDCGGSIHRINCKYFDFCPCCYMM